MEVQKKRINGWTIEMIAGAVLLLAGFVSCTIFGYKADSQVEVGGNLPTWERMTPFVLVGIGLTIGPISTGFRLNHSRAKWVAWGVTALVVMLIISTALIFTQP